MMLRKIPVLLLALVWVLPGQVEGQCSTECYGISGDKHRNEAKEPPPGGHNEGAHEAQPQ